MAHMRQSRPYSGLGFPVRVLKTFQVGPSSLRSGEGGTSPLVCKAQTFVSLNPRLESNKEEKKRVGPVEVVNEAVRDVAFAARR